MLTEPTNDPALLRTDNCGTQCPHCFRAMCGSHQNWKCICGHWRLNHVLFDWFGYGVIVEDNHPHLCTAHGCECQGLVYAEPHHFITNEQAVTGLLEVVEDLEG